MRGPYVILQAERAKLVAQSKTRSCQDYCQSKREGGGGEENLIRLLSGLGFFKSYLPNRLSMGHLRIRHLARTNRNALGGKGFGGNIFVAHGGKIFAISVVFTHQFVSCFFFFFSEPWKIRRPLQLSLTPTLTLHTWISFHFFKLGGRQRSPLGLYHSLHNHLRHPDDRRPGKKGRRVDADLALGFSLVLRSKPTASCRRLSSGGFRGVADFVHGKMNGMRV